MKPEDDNTPRTGSGKGHDFSEIKVKSEQDSLFGKRFFKNFPIGQLVQVLFAKMNRIMSLVSEPLDDPLGHSHIGKKSHPSYSE